MRFGITERSTEELREQMHRAIELGAHATAEMIERELVRRSEQDFNKGK